MVSIEKLFRSKLFFVVSIEKLFRSKLFFVVSIESLFRGFDQKFISSFRSKHYFVVSIETLFRSFDRKLVSWFRSKNRFDRNIISWFRLKDWICECTISISRRGVPDPNRLQTRPSLLSYLPLSTATSPASYLRSLELVRYSLNSYCFVARTTVCFHLRLHRALQPPLPVSAFGSSHFSLIFFGFWSFSFKGTYRIG